MVELRPGRVSELFRSIRVGGVESEMPSDAHLEIQPPPGFEFCPDSTTMVVPSEKMYRHYQSIVLGWEMERQPKTLAQAWTWHRQLREILGIDSF